MRRFCLWFCLTGWLWANPIDDLDRALQKNDLATVQAALKREPGLVKMRGSQLPPNTTTLLASAARWGRLEIVKAAVKGGADLEETGAQGLTPLALAAQSGHAAVVTYLISRKARLDGPDGPLGVAVAAGHLSIAKNLVQAGCPVNSRNLLGQTALHLAAQKNRQDCARYLLQQGADRKAQDWQGQTPAQRASDPKMKDLLR